MQPIAELVPIAMIRRTVNYISQRSDWELADIYADEGISGTQVEKRQDFQRLINDCVNGEIDYIVTKAIARFARNTLDTLKYVRMLKDMQIGVYFGEEDKYYIKDNHESIISKEDFEKA